MQGVSRTRAASAAKHTIALALVALALAASPARGETGSLKLLAFGDSLVHGYGLSGGETFPEQLQAALREDGLDVEVINAGNSGDTTAAGRARLDWSLAEKPDLVLLELGANDALRGLPPEETYNNLDAILARLQDERLPVILAGMQAPRNLGADYVEAFDGVYPRLAEKYDVVYYPFFLDGVALDPNLNQSDGIHPNAQGVAVIVARMLPHIVPMIDRIQNAKAPADG